VRRLDASDVPYLAGLLGLALVTAGAALVDVALGLIVPGTLCLLFAWSRTRGDG
jgi:hypothetical protein